MKLVSVKLNKKDREKEYPTASALADQPAYPWGLQVRLDENTLDKLGIDKLPEVGGELMLIAKVNVVSVSSSESAGSGGKRRNVELQITELCLEDVPADKDAAEELYEKG